MAAGYLPEPGKTLPDGQQLGPCVEKCDHPYCRALRADAESFCTICGEPIGYETGFFRGLGTDLDHARCVYAAEDAKVASRSGE